MYFVILFAIGVSLSSNAALTAESEQSKLCQFDNVTVGNVTNNFRSLNILNGLYKTRTAHKIRDRYEKIGDETLNCTKQVSRDDANMQCYICKTNDLDKVVTIAQGRELPITSSKPEITKDKHGNNIWKLPFFSPNPNVKVAMFCESQYDINTDRVYAALGRSIYLPCENFKVEEAQSFNYQQAHQTNGVL